MAASVGVALYACLAAVAALTIAATAVGASQSCQLDDETAYKRRVEAVKAQILSKLGLSEPPRANFSDDHPALSTDIMRTYRAATMRRRRRSALDSDADGHDASHDQYYSKTVTLLEVRGELAPDQQQHVVILLDHQHLKTKVGGNLSDVHKAELNFAFLPGQAHDKDAPIGSHQVRIELLERQASAVDGRPSARFVDGVDIDLGARDSIVFDVTRPVRRWLATPASCPDGTCRLELRVHAMHRDEADAARRFVDGIMLTAPPPPPTANSTGTERPQERGRELVDAHLLVMSHTATPDSRRLRRRAKRQTLDGEYCRRTRGRNPANCCVKDLELNFRRDLGWDWVREPEKFSPNHCAGACPYRWSSGSAYSSVISMYNNLNPQASAKPCCVADQLGSVILLFTTGSSTKEARVETLNMMTVQTCKCS